MSDTNTPKEKKDEKPKTQNTQAAPGGLVQNSSDGPIKEDEYKWNHSVGKETIGMPDATDRKNIQALIDKFEKANPGEIAQVRKEAIAERKERTAALKQNEFNIIHKDWDFRATGSFPPRLYKELKKSYPTIFTNKDHQAWFFKKFPQFLVADKY